MKPRDLAANWLALFLCLGFLANCASVSYVEPQSGNRARVRFAVVGGERARDSTWLQPENAWVHGYEDANCSGETDWMYLVDGFYVRPDPRLLQMPLWEYDENGAKEFYVSTDRTLNVMFVGSGSGFDGISSTTYYCPVFVSMDLKPNADYELIFRQDRLRTCSVRLNEIVSTESGFQRDLIRAYSNSGAISPGCVAAFARRY